LSALLPPLERKTDRSWRERVEEQVRGWWELMEARAMEEADPINPQRVLWELSPLAGQLHPHLRLGIGGKLSVQQLVKDVLPGRR
jgi:hypothetical protein